MLLRLRIKLVSFILKLTLVISIYVGLLPVRYNAARNKLESTKAYAIFGFCINIFNIGLLVFLLPRELDNKDVDFYAEKPLNKYINEVHVTVSLSTIFLTLLRNWIQRKRVVRIFSELYALQSVYFDKLMPESKNCETFRKYVIYKGLISLLQPFSTVCVMFGVGTPLRLEFVLTVGIVFVLESIYLLLENHFCFEMLYIYRYFWAINKHLKTIVGELEAKMAPNNGQLWPPPVGGIFQRRYSALADEVNIMSGAYGRLLKLAEQLTGQHEYQVLMGTIWFVSANVGHMFYFCVIWSGHVWDMSFWTMVLFPQTVLIDILNFWIIISACELALRESNETATILKSFNSFPGLDLRLSHNLDCFALLCSFRKLRFRICGLFDLHRRTGHQVVLTTILYLLFLVQFDFMNL